MRRAAAGLLALGLAAGVPVRAQTTPTPSPGAPAEAKQPALSPDVEAALTDLEAAEAAVAASPDDAVAVARYGLAQVRTGHADEGMATLVRASGMAPSDPAVQLLYAKGLMALKREAEAAETALKAARSPLATPRIAAEAFFMAGSLRWRQGLLEEAEGLLRQAVTSDPNNGGALMNLGLFLYSTGNIPEGVNFLQLAAERSPDNVNVQMRLARVMEAMGKADQAIVYWERAAALRPYDGDVAFILGNHYYTFGRYEEAAVQLKRSVDVNAADTNAHLAYGEVLLRLQRFDEARVQAELARKLGAGGPAESLLAAIELEQSQAGE